MKGAIESFLALAPNVKSFVLISQVNYVSSAIDWEGTKAACDELGLRCKQVEVSDRDEAVKAVTDNKDEFDAFIMGNQSAAFDNTDAAVAASGGKPVFSYAEKGVTLGALGGVVADDRKLGRMLADSLIAVLVNGKKIRDVPIKLDPQPMLIINMKSAAALGLEPPVELLSTAKIVE